jgi:hypothetical protein
MMMKMLGAGGLPVLIDAENPSTEENPGGAYAYIKTQLLRHPKYDWMDEAEGKAVKVVALLLSHLPSDHEYRVIFMERDDAEVGKSQAKVIAGRGYQTSDSPGRREVERKVTKAWLSRQPNFETLVVNYNGLMADPAASIESIGAFLGVKLDTDKMLKVPNAEYYRNRV